MAEIKIFIPRPVITGDKQMDITIREIIKALEDVKKELQKLEDNKQDAS